MATMTRKIFTSAELADRINAFQARWTNRQQRRMACLMAEHQMGHFTQHDLGLGRGSRGTFDNEVTGS